MEYRTETPQETEALGEALGRVLPPGSVVAYTGGLGAGKTAFTRGLARGLGIQDRVTSPTFTIVNEYEGEIPDTVRELVEAVNASKAKIAELEASKPVKAEEEAGAPDEAETAGKACPICGAVSDSKFCPQCGAPME